MKKNKDEFKILSDAEHLRRRPSMYIGSTAKEERTILLGSEYKTISYVPGLFKIVNEILDNSVDEYLKNDGTFANKIQVNMTDTSFEVIDNGRGIPVEYVTDDKGEKLYRPVAAWTKARSGSNFGLDEDRTTIGLNGVGSFATMCYSKVFNGDTYDGKKHLSLKVKDTITKTIKTSITTKRGTHVYCEPDFSFFDVDKFDDTFKELIKDRLANISLAYPKIEFKFNGQKCNRTLKQFQQSFPNAVIHSDKSTLLAIMPSEVGDFRFHAVTNGLINYNGGSHIDFAVNKIIPLLRESIKKKYKYDLAPAKIKAYLQIILVLNGFKNAKFDSQTKERITNTVAEVAQHLNHIDYEDLAKKIMKNDAIIIPMIEAQKLKAMDEDDAAANKKAKDLKGKKVAKHIAATSRISDKRKIFLVEGDSAGANFIAARNAETQGLLPLRGKVLNVYGKKRSDILENAAIADILNVIGLELGKKATNLNYGTICILTDADVDGYSIRGLLINLFALWPELFEQGRIEIHHSPRYILRGKKDRKYFYTDEEWNSYKGTTNGYELMYIKGLGTLELEEYIDMLQKPYFDKIVLDDKEAITQMYSDDADARKKIMME